MSHADDMVGDCLEYVLSAEPYEKKGMKLDNQVGVITNSSTSIITIPKTDKCETLAGMLGLDFIIFPEFEFCISELEEEETTEEWFEKEFGELVVKTGLYHKLDIDATKTYSDHKKGLALRLEKELYEIGEDDCRTLLHGAKVVFYNKDGTINQEWTDVIYDFYDTYESFDG